jgi:hypothetical protein
MRDDFQLRRECTTLLHEWAADGTTDESSRERQSVLERILEVSLSLQAIETSVPAAGEDVAAFYEQPVEVTTLPAGSPILVVQADGKGVPIVQPSAVAPPVRHGKGQKRTKQKKAVVTSLYTVAPYPRTPQEIVAACSQRAIARRSPRDQCGWAKNCAPLWRERRSQ